MLVFTWCFKIFLVSFVVIGYLEIVWPFWGLLFNIRWVGREQPLVQASFAPLLRQYPADASCPMNWELFVCLFLFLSGWWEEYSWPSVSPGEWLVPPASFWWFFPQSWIIFSNWCAVQLSNEDLGWEDSLKSSTVLSQCSSLLSSILHVNSTHQSILSSLHGLLSWGGVLASSWLLLHRATAENSVQWAWAVVGLTSNFVLSQGSLSFAASCSVSENSHFFSISFQFFSEVIR